MELGNDSFSRVPEYPAQPQLNQNILKRKRNLPPFKP